MTRGSEDTHVPCIHFLAGQGHLRGGDANVGARRLVYLASKDLRNLRPKAINFGHLNGTRSGAAQAAKWHHDAVWYLREESRLSISPRTRQELLHGRASYAPLPISGIRGEATVHRRGR